MAKKINKYIMAVKDYEETVKLLTEGGKVMPREASVYSDLFSNVVIKCSNFDELKKFIKVSKYSKKDCMHYWEGLLTLGYTLVIVDYEAEDENFVENTCDNEILKYISAVR